MNRIYTFVLMILLSFALAGCWIPEKFVADVKVHKDGSYIFKYDGILTFAIALDASNKGELTEKDERNFASEVGKLKEEPGFKKVKYLGKGRYKVLVEKAGNAEEKIYFLSKSLNYFTINPRKDGTLLITAEQFSKKDIKELKSIGAKIDGELTVSIEKGVEIIDHNAESEPKLFGLFGSYKWHINSIDYKPFMILKPQNNRTIALEKKKKKDPIYEQCSAVPPPDWDEPYAFDFKTKSNLTIRNAPSIRARKIGLLNKGTVVEGICSEFATLNKNVSGYWIDIGGDGKHMSRYVFSHYMELQK